MSGVRSTTHDVDVDLGRLFGSMWRRWPRILGVALLLTGLALVLAWIATPQYRAETRLLIETRESVFTRPDGVAESERLMLDEEGVTSQVEVIMSTDILMQVAQQLDLASRPEFDEAASMSLIERALVMAGLKGDPLEMPPEERVLKAFRERLAVYRVERSRVIVIQFSSADPKLAAEVPNAIADAYLKVGRDAKLASNTEATDWLEPEIADLSARVKEAEARVARFRAQSDLLVGQNDSVLATQQLSELSSELSRVRANRAAAAATAASVRTALDSGASLDTVPEVLSSTLIQRLREREVQLKADIADLSTTLLANHPRIRSLNSQLADLGRQIRTEAQNVLRGLENEAKAAQMRENQLVADLNKLKAESARAGDEAVELRALEREAAAQRELLESYLARYREAASRRDRSYLPADARIFSRAIVPSEPYFPKILPIVGATFVGSILLMAIATLLQELFSGRALRPAPHARFQPVDEVPMPAARLADAHPARAEVEAGEGVAARVGAVAEGVASPARFGLSAGEPRQPPVAANASAPPPGGIGIDAAAEQLIAGGASRAIFVSPEGEEAAASSVLVARAVADAGLRVLMLDLTATGAASRAMLDSGLYPGITNLLAAEAQFSEVIHSDHYSDCHVIPSGTANPVRAMRAADRLPIIMDSLTTAYDVVVVECGPTDAEGIRRLVAEGTEILVSVLEADDAAVSAAARDLRAAGHGRLTLVSPVGHVVTPPPAPGHSFEVGAGAA